VLHIALSVKNITAEIIKYLGNVIRIDAYQETDSNGMMPLHVACLYQHENIVEYVLQKCIQATQICDRNGKYPFHLACDWDECLATPIMHSLLDSFKDALCSETNDKSLPLHYYVINNPTMNDELFFLTQMIYQYQELLLKTNNQCETPLAIACQFCNDNVIRLLLIYGPDAVNYMDDNGNLPIHHLLQRRPFVNCNVIQQMVNIAPTMCVEPTCQNKQNYPTKLPLYYAI